MNCEIARHRILALPDLGTTPEGLAEHLQSCLACRTWQRLAQEVDAAAAALAIPPAPHGRKEALIAQFRSPQPATQPTPRIDPFLDLPQSSSRRAVVRSSASRVSWGERLARLWPAGLVAAGVLIAVVSWLTFRSDQRPNGTTAQLPPDPLLKEVVAAKVNLDKAASAAERIDVLAKLAGTLHEGARSLSKVSPGDMASLAAMYRLVVEDSLIAQARSLSPEEQRRLLPSYRDRLIQVEQEANRLAAESPVGSDQALREIAEAARTGRMELAKLIQGRAL